MKAYETIAHKNLCNIVEHRYSCRNYSSEPVARETINALLMAARLAPSACNIQPWTFIVADTEKSRELAFKAYPREWTRNVPAYIIVCGNHEEGWHRKIDGKDFTDVDCAIAAEHICLAAASLGLGSCWVCNFDPEVLSESFCLPPHIEPLVLIPIGFHDPGAPVPEKSRKPLDEIVRWEKF